MISPSTRRTSLIRRRPSLSRQRTSGSRRPLGVGEKGGQAEKQELDRISGLLRAGQCQEAEEILNGLAWVVGYLRDGCAGTLEEAILWHGGEAEQAKENFRNMPAADRAAVIKFIRSL